NSQRKIFREAAQANRDGFIATIEFALSGRKPAALLTSLVRSGVHLQSRRPEKVKTSLDLEKWLVGTGQLFEEADASEFLATNWRLADSEHTAAMERWREARDAQRVSQLQPTHGASDAAAIPCLVPGKVLTAAHRHDGANG